MRSDDDDDGTSGVVRSVRRLRGRIGRRRAVVVAVVVTAVVAAVVGATLARSTGDADDPPANATTVSRGTFATATPTAAAATDGTTITTAGRTPTTAAGPTTTTAGDSATGVTMPAGPCLGAARVVP